MGLAPGTVKILDFGLAKVCFPTGMSGDAETLATQDGGPDHLASPIWSSPAVHPECIDWIRSLPHGGARRAEEINDQSSDGLLE